jgi:lysylphosphatidylglycerol synthetase-like protein (DUF2156 family)
MSGDHGLDWTWLKAIAYIDREGSIPMSDIVPRSEVTKSGVKAVGAIAGGVTLLILAAVPVFGIIAGGVLLVAGLALTSSKSDRTAGIVTAVVGAASLVTGIFHGASWIMQVAGILFIGTGIYSLVKFFRGMKTRT